MTATTQDTECLLVYISEDWAETRGQEEVRQGYKKQTHFPEITSSCQTPPPKVSTTPQTALSVEDQVGHIYVETVKGRMELTIADSPKNEENLSRKPRRWLEPHFHIRYKWSNTLRPRIPPIVETNLLATHNHIGTLVSMQDKEICELSSQVTLFPGV